MYIHVHVCSIIMVTVPELRIFWPTILMNGSFNKILQIFERERERENIV